MENLFLLRDEFMNYDLKFFTSLQLQSFLARNSVPNNPIKSDNKHTIKQILERLKHIIKNERLYDITNPFVIVCSEELENLLGCRAMHISQVCNAIKNKLGLNKEAFLGHEAVVGSVINEPKAAYGEMSFYYMQEEDSNAYVKKCMTDPSSPLSEEFHQWLITYKASIGVNARFRLLPELRQIFETVAPIQNLQVLSSNQISQCLRRYISQKKAKFSVPNNPELLILGNDPLAIVMGQQTVFYPQMKRLLMKNLILVKDENLNGSNCNEEGGEGASTSQVETDSGAPPPPKLTTSVSMPARPATPAGFNRITSNDIVDLLEAQGYAKKRSRSGNQDDSRSEKSIKINPADHVAVLSCYATLLQRSLTVTGLPPFTQREGCPPSTQRVGCPSSSQREDREEVLDISSSDDDKDYELIEMKTEDIREKDSSNCDTRPGTPDTVVDETEHLSTSSQKLADFSSSSQKIDAKTINKNDSGFCSTRLSDFTGGNVATSSKDASVDGNDDIKKEMIKAEDSDLDCEEGEDEIDGFVVVQKKDAKSEEKLLDGSDVIETRDKNDEELIRKPARQISMTICLYCRESQRDASFVHGRTAHMICCYPCSKELLKKYKKRCPVCKDLVEKVVRMIVI